MVSDLDGTRLRSDGTLSPRSVDVLSTLWTLGVPFVVATARTPRAIGRIAGHEAFGRMVCAGGAVIWDAPSDEVLHERAFNPIALASAVARVRAAIPDVGVALLSSRTMFLDRNYVAVRHRRSAGAVAFTDPMDVVADHPIVMAAVRHPRLRADEYLERTARAFEGVGVASPAGLDAVDIAPGATTKSAGVADELARRGCRADATVVFGDMPGDLSLFAWAGWACAVANGHPDVLAAADEVVASNDDDGVAISVQRFLGL